MWQQTNSFMYRDDQPEAPVHSRLSDDVLAEVVHSADLRPQIDPVLAASFEQKLQRTHVGYAPTTAEDLLEWVKERQFLPWPDWKLLESAIQRDIGASATAIVDPIAWKLVLVSGPRKETLGIAAAEFAARLYAMFENTVTLWNVAK